MGEHTWIDEGAVAAHENDDVAVVVERRQVEPIQHVPFSPSKKAAPASFAACSIDESSGRVEAADSRFRMCHTMVCPATSTNAFPVRRLDPCLAGTMPMILGGFFTIQAIRTLRPETRMW
jgi:hypothetical protein